MDKRYRQTPPIKMARFEGPEEIKMVKKITPCLWFDGNAEEAVNFYLSVFKNSKMLNTAPYTVDTPSNKPIGSVMTITFELNEQEFMALNGGPFFKPNPSISFIVSCETKEDVDALWEKLSKGGKVLMELSEYPFSKRYGWLQDKYGFSWQLILPATKGEEGPPILPSLLFVGKNCGKAEEAITFYRSVFRNSKSANMARYGPDQKPDKEGTVMFADFMLEGYWFAVMDSAHKHNFTFNEAISFIIYCKDQKEIDHYYDKLSAVPEAEMCGWLKDKFGVSWQLVTVGFEKLMTGRNAKAVMMELLKMKRINVKRLEEAHEGENE